MIVRALKILAFPDLTARPGQKVSVSGDRAKELVEAGAAEIMEDQPEASTETEDQPEAQNQKKKAKGKRN